MALLVFSCLSYAQSFIVTATCGILSIALLITITCLEYKKDGVLNYLFFIIPYVAYGVLLAISNFAKYEIDIATRVLVPLALIAFSSSGYLFAKKKEFSLKTFMLFIYGAFALVSLINLIISLSQCGAFFNFKYGSMYIYYDGVSSSMPLKDIAFCLFGFGIKPTSIQFYSFAPSILLTGSIALFYLSPKKETKQFVTYCVYTLIALLSLILVTNKVMLITTILIVIFVPLLFGLTKLKGKMVKAAKITGIVLASLFVIVTIIFIINFQPWATGLHTFIASNKVLNFIFNSNVIIDNYKEILVNMFSSKKIFGYPTSYIGTSNNIVLNQLNFAGVFGLLFFLVFVIVGAFYLYQYYKKTNEDRLNKMLIISYIIGFVILMIINGSTTGWVFSSTCYPTYLLPMFLLIPLLFGYTFSKVQLEKGETNEE